MTPFLLELRSEEIPARMQVKAKADLARLFAEEIARAGLVATSIETFATPRRLALIAHGLPDVTAATREERKGPRANAPDAALAGFLRSTGLTRDQLVERGGVLFAVVEKPGRPTAAVLDDAIPAIVRAFPWPKSMRWGAESTTTESLRWVRPLEGIVALFGDTVVPCEVAGIHSGAATVGHRFHHPGIITLGSHDYAAKLHASHVVVHLSERCAIIRDGARALAAAEGLTLVEDEALVTENAGLTEWPVPLLGRFSPEFLDVPAEVIQLTMRANQKYSACRDVEGKLANAFICTANIDAVDGGAAIVAGNERVLAARLADAKFFWENDLRVPLDEQAAKLDRIVFHEKLGTVADKVDRVAKLARWLVETGVVKFSPPGGGGGEADGGGLSARVYDRGEAPSVSASAMPPPPEGEDLATLAERAARLCKADLVTGMVGEFPELQGVIGGHLARAQGEDPQVADAIRDHYKPVGQGDDVPTAPVTVAVSIADKLDTLFEFFALDERPTGSKDPFALRRGALSVLASLMQCATHFNFEEWFPVQSSISLWSIYDREQRKVIRSRIVALGESPTTTQIAVASISVYPSWYGDIATDYDALEPMIGEAVIIAGDDLSVEAGSAVDRHLNGAIQQFDNLKEFFADRLKVQQREAGVRHDLIDAVFALGGEDDLVRLLARVRALQAFVGTEDGAKLLGGYKRAANILKKEQPSPLRGEGGERSEPGEVRAPHGHASPDAAGASSSSPRSGEDDLSYTPEPCEAGLIAALDAAEPLAAAAVEREDFEGAMTALASLRAPIDAFFDAVTVNDADAAKRAARLALLARVTNAVHQVADFSKIEG